MRILLIDFHKPCVANYIKDHYGTTSALCATEGHGNSRPLPVERFFGADYPLGISLAPELIGIPCKRTISL